MSEETTFDSLIAALPAKRRVFVLAYLDCLNATEAASRAGYSKPHPEGSRLLRNATISEIVRLGMQQKAMPQDEVLARLAMLATASLEDFLTLEAEPGSDDSEYPAPIVNGEEDTAADRKPHPGHWRLDLAKAKRRGMLGALKKLKWGEHGPELELHSPEGPLTTLAKHYGLLVDRKEISGPNGVPLQVDTEAMRQAQEELSAWRQAQTEALSRLPNAAPIVPTSPTLTDN